MYLVNVETIGDWRKHARELLKRNISPKHITWQGHGQSALLFDDASFLSETVVNDNPKIPRDFFSLASIAACHRHPDRWAVLYSVAWRLVYEDRRLLEFKIDSEVANLFAKRKAVSRDIHKMKAFVRFQKINASEEATLQPHDTPTNDIAECEASSEQFVAWFEPEHLIVPTACAFFVKRFHNMKWSILTPDICAHWDLDELSFTDGCAKAPKIADELETLWLKYYASTFNPARLKIKAMQSEMPKKYWHNLPEAALIPELIRKASNRSDEMITESTTEAWNKTAKSQFIKDTQKTLRGR